MVRGVSSGSGEFCRAIFVKRGPPRSFLGVVALLVGGAIIQFPATSSGVALATTSSLPFLGVGFGVVGGPRVPRVALVSLRGIREIVGAVGAEKPLFKGGVSGFPSVTVFGHMMPLFVGGVVPTQRIFPPR